MSDEEGTIEFESDSEDVGGSEDDHNKRAHHNALERRRRDHIKDSFNALRDYIPALAGVESTSRATILKASSDYVAHLQSEYKRLIENSNKATEILNVLFEAMEEEGIELDLSDIERDDERIKRRFNYDVEDEFESSEDDDDESTRRENSSEGELGDSSEDEEIDHQSKRFKS